MTAKELAEASTTELTRPAAGPVLRFDDSRFTPMDCAKFVLNPIQKDHNP